jgi:hypothetical protein
MEYTYQQVILPPSIEISSNYIKRLPDSALIPNDPDNVDWQQYQLWLSQGNVPLPPA